MNDDELRSALSRRAARQLTADERNDILRTARVRATQPRPRRSFAPRLFGAVAGLAAVLVLVLIGLPIVLSPPVPVGRPSPSSVAQSTARPTIEASPTAEATPPPAKGVTVYTAEGLASLIGNPGFVGKSVLAELPAGEIQHDPCSSPLGTPVNSCNHGTLSTVTGPRTSVVVGTRDATSADGVRQDDGSGYRWVKPLAWPTDAGVYAFAIGSDAAEYLGPVNDTSALAVVDLVKAKSNPTDDVFVVNGWLGITPPAPCAFPQQGLQSPMPDISSYYCGGSWLSDQQWEPPAQGLVVDGALHVQGNAYQQFAPQPDTAGFASKSQLGTYLVRNAGCPELVTGDCPVWRMVGRLDGSKSEPPPTPPSPPQSPVPAPPVHVSNQTTLTLTVNVDGNEAAVSQPGTEIDVDPSSYAQPWHVTVTTAAGRQLIDLTYSASDIDSSGDSQHGVAQRVDLSCGRLDVYAGPPMAGPAPPGSFPPGDCVP